MNTIKEGTITGVLAGGINKPLETVCSEQDGYLICPTHDGARSVRSRRKRQNFKRTRKIRNAKPSRKGRSTHDGSKNSCSDQSPNLVFGDFEPVTVIETAIRNVSPRKRATRRGKRSNSSTSSNHSTSLPGSPFGDDLLSSDDVESLVNGSGSPRMQREKSRCDKRKNNSTPIQQTEIDINVKPVVDLHVLVPDRIDLNTNEVEEIVMRDVQSCQPTKSMWANMCNSVREYMFDSPLARFVCCLDDSMVSMYHEGRFREEQLRENLLTQNAHRSSSNCVEQTILDVYMNTGYDLTTTTSKVDVVIDEKIEKRIAENRFISRKAQHIPKFAAAMVLSLRMDHGRMTLNDANSLLLERSYNRKCKKLNIRNVDSVSHYQSVANAYFDEYALDSIALARTKLPKWLQRSRNIYPNVRAC